MFCMRCHKRGETQAIVEGVDVCKACQYKITEIANFFEHFGWGFNHKLVPVEDLGNTTLAPLNGTESAAKEPAKA